MNKQISRLHFITYKNDSECIKSQVQSYCAGGGNWVQLRLKNTPDDEIKKIAQSCMNICFEYNATFIINDHVHIAAALYADGVHLGKSDMSPLEAREILGDDKIIGATANTLEDVIRLSKEKVDYIGLGPYRFTTTKDNLSPVIGLDGYKKIINTCKQENINLPIIGIGGIQEEDILSLFDTGLYGIAVSSALANAENTGMETIKYLTAIGKAQSRIYLKK